MGHTIEATAYHEAGHAVVGFFQGLTIHYATIEPEDNARGHVRMCCYERSDWGGAPDLPLARRRFLCLWAGYLAVKRYKRHGYTRGAGQDFQDIDALVKRCGLEDDESNWIWNLQVQAGKAVASCWPEIEEVAAMLLEWECVCGHEVRRICLERNLFQRQECL